MKAAKRICPGAGCRRIVEQGTRCPEHQREKRPDNRGSAASRGYGHRWRVHYRDPYLAQHPLCEHCEREGRTVAATDVDHVQPHEGNEALLFSMDNLQALCGTCHRRKTASERKYR